MTKIFPPAVKAGATTDTLSCMGALPRIVCAAGVFAYKRETTLESNCLVDDQRRLKRRYCQWHPLKLYT